MKTILFLDGSDIPQLCRRDKVKVTDEASLGNEDEYLAPVDFLESLRQLTAECLFDLIVLGNNQGVGLAKGTAISQGQRSNTIVVSNGVLGQGIRREYERSGYTRFMTRIELSEALDKLLNP